MAVTGVMVVAMLSLWMPLLPQLPAMLVRTWCAGAATVIGWSEDSQVRFLNLSTGGKTHERSHTYALIKFLPTIRLVRLFCH